MGQKLNYTFVGSIDFFDSSLWTWLGKICEIQLDVLISLPLREWCKKGSPLLDEALIYRYGSSREKTISIHNSAIEPISTHTK